MCRCVWMMAGPSSLTWPNLIGLEGGGWFQIFAFLSPKNAVTVYTKGTSDKIFCRFYPQAPSCKRGLKQRDGCRNATAHVWGAGADLAQM